MDPRKPLVLIADSDPSVRRQVTSALQTASIEVVEARNGRDALEMADRFHPELILLDVTTPLIDGYKVCQYIKSDPQTRWSKVVLISSQASDLRGAIEAGADECLAKPIDKGDVVLKVQKLLKSPCPSTAVAPDPHARRELRKPVEASTVTWGSRIGGKYEVMFKERVIDLSSKGLAFEHVRCDVCTGYEKDTVHPNCPFASYARCFHSTEPLSFVITLPSRKVIEVMGKVAHIYQPEDTPRTEKVGVVFTEISREASKAIREFLDQKGQ
jgi:CheY-like chemotaxis protein